MTDAVVTPKRKQKKEYIYAVGRRKEAVARVRLYASLKEDAVWGKESLSKGQIYVNEKPIEHYFPGPVMKAQYIKPLELTQASEKYAVTVKVVGGGQMSQLDAFVHGLSRALSLAQPKTFRPVLKSAGLLTRDARVRERRKVGTGGKARRAKQSPKR
jgi:small subunit ribosomal protein S9